MKSALLFIALGLAPALAAADVLPPHPQWPEQCVGDKKPGDACAMAGNFRGKCALLTERERIAMDISNTRRCRGKDNFGEPCLVCVSEAYRSSGPPKKSPDAGKPK